RRHYRARKPAGDFLQTRREVDGRTDAGEVEPAGAADIAKQNAADMQRHAETETFDALAARVAHGIDIGARLARSLQHAGANFIDIAVVLCDREHGEQSVAHELQYLSTVPANCRHLAVEILIEDVDHD